MKDAEFTAAMEHIVAALKEKGYDPYAKLTGYVTKKEPTYITSYRGARQLIVTLDTAQVKEYAKTMRMHD